MALSLAWFLSPCKPSTLSCLPSFSQSLHLQPALSFPFKSSSLHITLAAHFSNNKDLHQEPKNKEDTNDAAREDFFLQNQWRFEEDKFQHVLEAGRVDGASDVLVGLGNEAFMDQLCLLSPSSVELIHFSLLTLAMVKEKHDTVHCWHIESPHFPFPPGPFHVAFLHHFSAFYKSPSNLFSAVAAICKSDARIILSYPRGKYDLAKLREQEPKILLSDLPTLKDLESLLSSLPLEIVNVQDDSDFYLAVLKVTKNRL